MGAAEARVLPTVARRRTPPPLEAVMATTSTHHPAPRARTARRTAAGSAGLGSALVNLVLLYVVNVRPGWEAASFLTPEAADVLPSVNAALWTGVGVGVGLTLLHGVVIRALGDLLTTVVGLAATLRVWDVFPFDLTSGWHLTVRVLLVVAIVGSMLGIVAALVRLLGSIWRPDE
jgi:hypothetical protein